MDTIIITDNPSFQEVIFELFSSCSDFASLSKSSRKPRERSRSSCCCLRSSCCRCLQRCSHSNHCCSCHRRCVREQPLTLHAWNGFSIQAIPLKINNTTSASACLSHGYALTNLRSIDRTYLLRSLPGFLPCAP